MGSIEEPSWVIRRRPLDEEMWERHRGHELEAAIACLKRIRHYWTCCFPGYGLVIVNDDDDGLYETLYHDLFFVLAQRQDLEPIAVDLRSLVLSAENLPTRGDADGYDHDIESAILDDIRQARLILNRAAILDGRPVPGGRPISLMDGQREESPTQFLFSMFDDELMAFEGHAKRQARAMAIRLGIIRLPAAVQHRPAKGRPKGSTTYTLEDVRTRLRQFRADGHDLEKPAFLAHCGISESTWKRYTADWGKRWTDLVRELD